MPLPSLNAAAPGATVLTARQGDTLDGLIWAAFARGSGMVEAVLAANRGLAGVGAVLAEGTRVIVPAASVSLATTDEVKLWD